MIYFGYLIPSKKLNSIKIQKYFIENGILIQIEQLIQTIVTSLQRPTIGIEDKNDCFLMIGKIFALMEVMAYNLEDIHLKVISESSIGLNIINQSL